MSTEIQLRIRHPDGVNLLNSLTEKSSIGDLKQQLLTFVKAKPSEIVLLSGYPPSHLLYPDETSLEEAQITSGETLIVEIHKSNETAEVQNQPSSSKKKVLSKSKSSLSDANSSTIASKENNDNAENNDPQHMIEEATGEEWFPRQRLTKQKILDEIDQKDASISRATKKPMESNSRKEEDSAAELYKSELMSFGSKVSAVSNASYKNKETAKTQQKLNFPKEKTTRASHRQEESAKARDDSKESVDSFFELQNDNRRGLKRLKKGKTEETRSQGMKSEHEMSQEELDAQFARALQE